ncbi:Uncharacterized protein GBIM_02430 [Gryllus bimaculatus]|nr:Uncharacterized protein GBIM_02430 [Gryllus bimaculatus]
MPSGEEGVSLCLRRMSGRRSCTRYAGGTARALARAGRRVGARPQRLGLRTPPTAATTSRHLTGEAAEGRWGDEGGREGEGRRGGTRGRGHGGGQGGEGRGQGWTDGRTERTGRTDGEIRRRRDRTGRTESGVGAEAPFGRASLGQVGLVVGKVLQRGARRGKLGRLYGYPRKALRVRCCSAARPGSARGVFALVRLLLHRPGAGLPEDRCRSPFRRGSPFLNHESMMRRELLSFRCGDNSQGALVGPRRLSGGKHLPLPGVQRCTTRALSMGCPGTRVEGWTILSKESICESLRQARPAVEVRWRARFTLRSKYSRASADFYSYGSMPIAGSVCAAKLHAYVGAWLALRGRCARGARACSAWACATRPTPTTLLAHLQVRRRGTVGTKREGLEDERERGGREGGTRGGARDEGEGREGGEGTGGEERGEGGEGMTDGRTNGRTEDGRDGRTDGDGRQDGEREHGGRTIRARVMGGGLVGGQGGLQARGHGVGAGPAFSYAAETAFVSPLLLQLRVERRVMTLAWALSPLVGFFLTPVLGSLSDRCRSPFGRRRPFLVLLSAGVLIAATALFRWWYMSRTKSDNNIMTALPLHRFIIITIIIIIIIIYYLNIF